MVAKEHPDLEEAKNKLIISNAKMKQELKETEDEIVSCLNSGQGNPEDQISVLDDLKIKAGEIKVRQLKRCFSNINCVLRFKNVGSHLQFPLKPEKVFECNH